MQSNNTFCTIITASHLSYAYTIYDSLYCFDQDIVLNVLVVDFDALKNPVSQRKNVLLFPINTIISASDTGSEINNKYNLPATQDELRWSLKPIFINYLLGQGYEKVIFTDPDTFYFSDYNFLFTALDEFDVLLTPHWRGLNPALNDANFNLQFVGGLFNAGFIGVNKKAKKTMDWWAEACLYKCEINFSIGHYVDQTYLNLMPIYFDKVKILKHKGCNVANWNQDVCHRASRNGKVIISGKYDVVFIHFTASMFKGIVNGKDLLLKPYLNEYTEILKKNGKELNLKNFVESDKIEVERDKYWKAKNWLNKKIKRL